jgi:acetate kinase
VSAARSHMNVLVLNCGSSTVKFQLIATDPKDTEPQMNTDKHRSTLGAQASLPAVSQFEHIPTSCLILSVFICVHLWLLFP